MWKWESHSISWANPNIKTLGFSWFLVSLPQQFLEQSRVLLFYWARSQSIDWAFGIDPWKLLPEWSYMIDLELNLEHWFRNDLGNCFGSGVMHGTLINLIPKINFWDWSQRNFKYSKGSVTQVNFKTNFLCMDCDWSHTMIRASHHSQGFYSKKEKPITYLRTCLRHTRVSLSTL